MCNTLAHSSNDNYYKQIKNDVAKHIEERENCYNVRGMNTNIRESIMKSSVNSTLKKIEIKIEYGSLR